MTRRQRLARWLEPYRALLQEERRRSTALRATVVERNATIAALDLELAITKAREKVAVEARDRARDLAGALMGEERAFSAGDLAWLDDNGVGAE